MPAADTRSPSEYCLRGAVGGIDRSFPLLVGENRLGSLESNEIVLVSRGVSRRHAHLVLVGKELEVEDLASKNGTFVGGQRVERGIASLGQELRFGPVTLCFQKYHADDTELAIAFDQGITEQTGTVPYLESVVAGNGFVSSQSDLWLQLAEAFLVHLYRKSDGDLGGALNLLVAELKLQCAALMEIPDAGDPVVLAASGQLQKSATGELERLFGEARQSASHGAGFVTTSPGDGSALTLAGIVQPESPPLVLALWGAFAGREESEVVLRLLARMLDACRQRRERTMEQRPPVEYPRLIVPPGYVYAQSAAMGKIYGLMQTLAQGDLPILIVGETGVGKEYLAHILHRSSPRRDGPFVAINCAAIPAEMLEAELFGIGDRVATGVAASKGRLQQAHGGTLLLDEIGDMSADLQAKLLRALQEKEVHPVGREPVAIDVRVLGATNQNLSGNIDSGAFRADLYYRMAGYVLEIPPLKDRPEDVPALVEHFVRSCAEELRRPIRGLTVRALRLLVEYPWPGNVRELANEVRRAVYLCRENHTIDSSILSRTLRESRGGVPDHGEPEVVAETREMLLQPPSDDSQVLPAPLGLGLDSLKLEHLEAQAVEEALRRCRGNQVQAAKLLGLSRQSLRRRMERLGHLKPPG